MAFTKTKIKNYIRILNESLDESDKDEYQEKFRKVMKKYGITSIKDLPDDKKDDFFNDVDKMHTSDKEEMKEGCGKEGCNCGPDCDCGPGSTCDCGSAKESVNEAKYTMKNGKAHITKAEFRKIHKDYKKITKGKEMMMVNDPQSGEVRLVPVVFEGRNPKITRKEMEEVRMFAEKNTPTDKKKWAASVAAAKKKFKVYPSAYANAWAAKNYKEKGGTWRSTKG